MAGGAAAAVQNICARLGMGQRTVVALGVLALQIFGSYRLIANTCKWLTLALLAYVVDVFIVHPDLLQALRATIVPRFSLDPLYVTTLVAILGTTISPYLFFWQSSEEVEEEIDMGRRTEKARRGASPASRTRASSFVPAVRRGTEPAPRPRSAVVHDRTRRRRRHRLPHGRTVAGKRAG